MIEKLIYDARELRAGSKTAEIDAQRGYEQLIADSNDMIQSLQKQIVFKTQSKIAAQKDEQESQDDLSDVLKELDGLAKYKAELHTECDYLLRNFDLRQKERGEEVEALQQAKQILSGASLTD